MRHLLALLELWSGRLDSHRSDAVVHAQRLVVVCLGNINRSAFACAVARHCGDTAVSIGLSTTTGAPATPAAIRQAAPQACWTSPAAFERYGVGRSRH